MASFIDARCPKCDRKIGWFGELKDRPPCPRCGHVVPYDPAAEKQFNDALDELRQEMLGRKKQKGLSELMGQPKAVDKVEKETDDMLDFLKGNKDVPNIE